MAKRMKPVAKKNTKAFPWLWVIGLLIIVGVGALAFNLLSEPSEATSASLPREISVDDALQKRESGAFMLDVREQDEWDQGHIPGATLIPLAELPSRLAEVPKDQEVVVVCRSGNRSATGRDILLNAGFSQVASMAGGMNNWSAKGYPTAAGR